MKVSLTFDMDDPHDRYEHDIFMKRKDNYRALLEAYTELRKLWKYTDDATADDMWEAFCKVLSDFNIEI